jgi:hypothetical protein
LRLKGLNEKREVKAMETQSPTRRDMETALIEKCWKDPEFKKAVISDPKAMLEQRIGRKLPPNLKIVIHEEDANTLHFTIPPAPGNLTELSDAELENVAGGTDLVLTVAAISAGLVGSALVSAAAGTKKDGGW